MRRRGAGWCAAGGLLSINLSPRSLEHDEVVQALSNAMYRAGIAPHQLTMALTESSLRLGRSSVTKNLESLRRLGARLAIDDFGTGGPRCHSCAAPRSTCSRSTGTSSP